MDRRIKKTNRAIFEAYIRAKKSHPETEPSVKELCAIADINKTTFYRYFTDVNALSYSVIDAFINKLLIEGIKIEYLFTDPETYFRHVLSKLNTCEDVMTALLADNPHAFMFEAERIIKSELKKTAEEKYDEVLCTFIAGGAAHFFLSADRSREADITKLCRIIKAATSAFYD